MPCASSASSVLPSWLTGFLRRPVIIGTEGP
jgi:hypothetical protein